MKCIEKRHCLAFVVLLIALAGFGIVNFPAGNHLGYVMGPTLQDLESAYLP